LPKSLLAPGKNSYGVLSIDYELGI
jgi:hypothetical protein